MMCAAPGRIITICDLQPAGERILRSFPTFATTELLKSYPSKHPGNQYTRRILVYRWELVNRSIRGLSEFRVADRLCDSDHPFR